MAPSWHAYDILYLVRTLKTDLKTGLTTKEAMSRIHESANRDLTLHQEKSVGGVLWQQARTAKTGILLLLALVSVGAAQWLGTDTYWQAAVLVGIAVVDALLRTLQRSVIGYHLWLVERGTDRKATVLRNGEPAQTDPEDVVVGDVLRVQSGDFIPADARVFEAKQLRINEMPLTGISDLIEKQDVLLEGEQALHDQTNILFAGSYVHSGSGSAIVVATGPDRAICERYSRRYLELPASEAHKQLARAVPRAAWAAAAVGVALAALLVQLGDQSTAAIVQSVSLGAAVLAGLFPASAQLTAAILFVQSLRQLEGMGTIVQKSAALEELSLATALCFDSQGVITHEEMTLHSVFVDGQVFSGQAAIGFFSEEEPEEESEPSEQETAESADLEQKTGVTTASGAETPVDLYFLILAAAFCARYAAPGDEGREAMEPLTKRALLHVADAVGAESKSYESLLARVNTLPYDQTRGSQAVLFESEPDQGYLFVVGGAESVLQKCRMIRLQGDEDVLEGRKRESLMYLNDHLHRDAREVLTIAYRKVAGDLTQIGEDLEGYDSALTLLGMLSFEDTLREDLEPVLDRCARAGLRLILMSDYETSSAYRLARDANLLEHRSQILSDSQLRRMDDGEFMSHIDRVSVYSRLKGEQKARVVQLLKRKGNRVAFVGRQLFDIAALRGADVGIAPNQWSADAAAHEAGILVDDVSLGNLYGVLKFAKDAGDRVRRLVHWTLSTHIGLGLALILGLVLAEVGISVRVPVELNQILWLELLVFGVPFAFAGHALCLVPSRRWLVANRNVRARIHWPGVFLQGAIVAVMSLVAGSFFYQGGFLSETSPDTALVTQSAQHATIAAFLCCSLVILIRELTGPDGSVFAFLRVNGWLVFGALAAIALAFAVTASPIAGVFSAPEGIALGQVAITRDWLVVPLLAVVAWLVPLIK